MQPKKWEQNYKKWEQKNKKWEQKNKKWEFLDCLAKRKHLEPQHFFGFYKIPVGNCM